MSSGDFVRRLADELAKTLPTTVNQTANSALVVDWEAAASRLAMWTDDFAQVGPSQATVFLVGARTELVSATEAWLAGLYRSARLALRPILDLVQAYTFYRVHPAHLAAALADPSRFVSRADVEKFHGEVTPKFGERWEALSLHTRFAALYSDLSQHVHAQHPNTMSHAGTVARCFNEAQAGAVAGLLATVEATARQFALIACPDCWSDLSLPTRELLVSGIPRKQLDELGIGP